MTERIHQEVDGGVAVPQWASVLGSERHTNKPSDPQRMFGAILGKPGCGKTSFFMDAPNTLLLNLDKTALPIHQTPKAQVWTPGKRGWADLVVLKDKLVGLAEAGQPRPKMVVVDTVAGLTQIVQDNLVRVTQGKESWSELDGRYAYDRIYYQMLGLWSALHEAGYGVWIVLHIIEKQFGSGDEAVLKHTLTITENFWKKFFWALDFSGAITKETSVRNRMVEQKLTSGKTRQGTQRVEETIHTLTTEKPYLEGWTKTRCALPDIQLPKDGGWSAFCREYEEAFLNPGKDES